LSRPPPQCADLQALALLCVRLLAHQLRQVPLLLGPSTPGALAGALGRFLACGSPELQVRGLGALRCWLSLGAAK
jgi:hypothetical protein